MRARNAYLIIRLSRMYRYILEHQGGAVLVEFAIAANILIMMNIFAYDFASYYRMSEQVKHGTQFIQTNLANDADHALTKTNLESQVTYLNAVTGLDDFSRNGALALMGVIPYYSGTTKSWSLLVCWSWSSNPKLKPVPDQGTFLPPDHYRVGPWIPGSGVSANLALVVVETVQSNPRLFDVSLVPEMTTQTFIAPVRYAQGQKLNLHLYNYLGSASLNNATVREPNPSNAIACQR